MAKKFRFRLEGVERIRRQQRDTRRRRLAEALGRVVDVERCIAQLSQELRETVEGSRSARGGGCLDMTVVRGHQYYRGVLQRNLLEQTQALADRQDAVRVARQELAQATARLKVIEKLRERAQDRHRKELQREEQTALNEIATTAYIRRAPGRAEVVMPS
ncbi:MAG: flagellar export protein FliJ [Phycisphaerae bacterium]